MTAMTVAQITPEFITNMYLYGQATRPANLADDAVIRAAGQAPLIVEVDTDDYMQNGPGRFASPALFEVIRVFFEESPNLPVGVYTDVALNNRFGLSGEERILVDCL